MAMQGRTAAITGTTRAAGIGQACAKLLYKNGYNIVGIDNAEHEFASDAPWHTAELDAAAAATVTSASSHDQQPHCAWLKLDLSQPELILSVPEQMQKLGVESVNVLVNNAGIANPYMQSDSLSERAALWQGYIATNLTAPFLLSEALLPLMVQGEGSIVHVSSTRALQSEPHSEVRRTIMICLLLSCSAAAYEHPQAANAMHGKVQQVGMAMCAFLRMPTAWDPCYRPLCSRTVGNTCL
jgi:NAD(P)-dependent dehydrogenase (short-subunit alcohol dehydrogenase family)